MVVLLTSVYHPLSALAQTSSQITPPTFQPRPPRTASFSIPEGSGLSAPKGAEKLQLTLSGLQITGGRPEFGPKEAALEVKLTRQEISGADVFAAARELEAAYAAAGFVLVRVILPPQKLTKGSSLRLTVIDGFIEKIELKDIPERVRERVKNLLEPLIGKRGIKLSEIERQVLFASDTPGVLLRSTLAPGTEVGGTLLVVEARHKALMASITADNSLSKALGQSAPSIGIDANSVGGLGELFYIRAGGVTNFSSDGFFSNYPLNRSLSIGLSMPLSVDGLSFTAEYTDARTTPSTASGIKTTDTFDRFSLRLRYAWTRSRSMNLYSEAVLDFEDETRSLFVGGIPTPLSLDRLRILRLNNEGDLATPWGATIAGRVTFSFGIDGLGARAAPSTVAALPLSRQGATAAFQKAEIALGYGQIIADHLATNISFRAQTSFNRALVHAEQFGITGPSGLSTFSSGTVAGDQGYVARAEISSPWLVPYPPFKVMMRVAPYVFGATGEVGLVRPTAVEVGSIRASSFGAGIRIGGTHSTALSDGSLNLEYGHSTRNDGGAAINRFSIATGLKF